MVARHCSQIEAQENTLGRHYSRFCPFPLTPTKQYQPVAQPAKCENRHFKRRIGEVRIARETERRPCDDKAYAAGGCATKSSNPTATGRCRRTFDLPGGVTRFHA